MFSSIFLSFCLLTVPDEDQTQLDFFETRIRPVLVRECYACHSQTAGKAEGSLLLDTRDSTRRGGDRGPAVVPNEPDRSWLLIALRHSDSDLRMPPRKSRLSADVIQDFETWIKAGAVDPRTSEVSASTQGSSLAGSQHWRISRP